MAPPAAPLQTEEPPPPPPPAQAEAQDREVVAQGAVLTDATDDAHKGAIVQGPAEEPAAETVTPPAEERPGSTGQGGG